MLLFLHRWAGQALFGTLTPDIIVLTLLYSIAGVCISHSGIIYPWHDQLVLLVCLNHITFQLGIAIVNDFKSIEGDRALGLQVSLILHQSIPCFMKCLSILIKSYFSLKK